MSDKVAINLSGEQLVRTVREPKAAHTATVIFVHGLGDSGKGIPMLITHSLADREPALDHVKWIFPHAPQRAVTLNAGQVMPAWYDVFENGLGASDIPKPDDEEGMLDSARQIKEIIAAEVQTGVPGDRIVLGGFSQGGAMTFLAGLTGQHKLAGLFPLGARIPLRDKFTSLVNRDVLGVPIFYGHGTADKVVPYHVAELCRGILIDDLGVKVAPAKDPKAGLTFRAYDGVEHTICQDAIIDLQAWLKQIIPSTSQ